MSCASSTRIHLHLEPLFVRRAFRCVLLISLACTRLPSLPAQTTAPRSPQRAAPAPIERRPPPAEAPLRRSQPTENNPGSTPNQHPDQHLAQQHITQQHLAQWLESHRNLPLAQQQNALSAEPGFRSLQPQVQQRMHDRLTQLNTMPPEQRQHVIAHTEAMERLTPPQRQQVRGAMQQLGNLPDDRRRVVARTFRSLRDMPEPQRQTYTNSPEFRSQFSEEEQGTLDNLIKVAPYLPPPSGPAQPPR